MSIQEVIIKQYDSVALHCQYSDDNGNPLTLVGTKVNSDIKSADGEYTRQLEVKIIDEVKGEFVLMSTSISLAPTKYSIDVLFEDIKTERRIASETFILNVHEAVTVPRW